MAHKQVEKRRQAIADRFAHAWSKSSTRIPVPLKEYRALLDLWDVVHQRYSDDSCMNEDEIIKALENLEKLK